MAEYEKPKDKRRRIKFERSIVRERRWIEDYERKQGTAIGQVGYRLPGTARSSS